MVADTVKEWPVAALRAKTPDTGSRMRDFTLSVCVRQPGKLLKSSVDEGFHFFAVPTGAGKFSVHDKCWDVEESVPKLFPQAQGTERVDHANVNPMLVQPSDLFKALDHPRNGFSPMLRELLAGGIVMLFPNARLGKNQTATSAPECLAGQHGSDHLDENRPHHIQQPSAQWASAAIVVSCLPIAKVRTRRMLI
jgi:hypothetical protein